MGICIIILSCNSVYCSARVNGLLHTGCELMMSHNVLYEPGVLSTALECNRLYSLRLTAIIGQAKTQGLEGLRVRSQNIPSCLCSSTVHLTTVHFP
jgi:hypothetical protein